MSQPNPQSNVTGDEDNNASNPLNALTTDPIVQSTLQTTLTVNPSQNIGGDSGGDHTQQTSQKTAGDTGADDDDRAAIELLDTTTGNIQPRATHHGPIPTLIRTLTLGL